MNGTNILRKSNISKDVARVVVIVVWINWIRLPILLVVRSTRKWKLPCLCSSLRIWSRETGSAVPSRVSPLILHAHADSGAYPPRDSSRFPRRRGPFIFLNRQTPSGQSRVHRVTNLRTDGVHCRESAGTGPESFKLFQLRVLYLHDHGPIIMRLSFFPTPTLLLV